MFTCFRNCQNNLPNWLYHFSFLPPKYESFSCLLSSPLLLVMQTYLLHFSPFNGYVVITCIYLLFPSRLMMMLSTFSCLYLSWPMTNYLPWWSICSSILPIFETVLFIFFLLTFEHSLYILYPSPFSGIYTMNIFSTVSSLCFKK